MHRNRHAIVKILSGIFFTVLILQASIVIPRTDRECRCGELYPHTAQCTCQCPKCVKVTTEPSCCSRAAPMCHSSESSRENCQPTTGSNAPSLKNFCGCGSRGTEFNVPGDSPFLPHETAATPCLCRLSDSILPFLPYYSEYSDSIHPLPG